MNLPDRAAAPALPERAVRERVFRNTTAALAARVATDGFQVLAAIKLARCLGEQEWGLYGYLLASLDIFRVLTNFGLDVVGIRLMAVGAWPPRAVVRHLLLLKTALCAAGLVGVGAVSLFVPRLAEHRGPLLLLGLALFPIALLSSVTVRFQTEHRMERLIPAQLAAGALYLLYVYAGAALGWRLPGFVALFAASQLLTYLLTAGVARRTWPPPGAREAARGIDHALLLTILRQGVPVGGAMILVVVYSRLGVFLLERFQGLEAVGQYYIALKISEPLLAIAGALSMSAYPVFSRLAQRGAAAELRRRFVRYSARSAVVSVAAAAVLTVCSTLLLRAIRPEYAAAAGALTALGWASACMFQNQLSTSAINAFGKFHWISAFAAFNLGTYLVGSLLLIRSLGATGAGLATLCTEGVNVVVQIAAVSILLRRLQSAGPAAPVS